MSATVAEAVGALAAGRLVAFPTETVYGLGADATHPGAVAKIFALKGRPAEHPVIVHLAKGAKLEPWAAEVPDAARALAAAFWPGPLTMILRKSDRVPAIVTGGQDTVGLRCPAHALAQSLLVAFVQVGSGAIAAPSANRFGHVSPTTAQHVRDEFGPELPVLDGGPCEVGIESTIVDLSRGDSVLLRPGAISREAIAAVLGVAPRSADAAAPRAPGALAAHYAPGTPLELVAESELEARVREARRRGVRVAVLARGPARGTAADFWRESRGDAPAYAHDLYTNLRALDASGAGLIVVEAPPEEPAWEAVNDRLARAAAGSGGDDET